MKISNRSLIDSTPSTDVNRFNILPHEEDMETEENTPMSRPHTAGTTRKAHKQPPIYTVDTNINLLINAMSVINMPKTAFTIKEVSKDNHIIYAQSAEHYKAISEMLLANKTQYYTFTPKDLKPKSILIKGIKGNFSLDDIKQELIDLNLPEVEITNLTKLIYNKTNPESYHYLLQLSTNSKTKELFKIKTLAYQSVRWEHMRKPSIFQCRKCQRLGHASKNCFLQYRCVKCASSHEPGSCSITNENSKQQLKCANCGQEGHPASYKGCPYIKFAHQQICKEKASKNQASARKFDRITATIRGGTSFAQAVSGRSQRNPITQRNEQPRIPASQDTETTSQPSEHHQYQERRQSATHPTWVTEFKNELAELVSSQFKMLAARVAENSLKIDYILNTYIGNKNVQ